MDIYQALHTDHEKVLGLVDKLIAAEKSDSQNKEKLISQIRDELVPHSRAEEAVLYNMMREVSGTQGIVAHAYQEHVEAETILRSLQVAGLAGVAWVAGATKLKEALSHHIKEEEGNVFAAAKKLFISEEAEAMAEVFNKMKPAIKEQSALGTSMDMLVNMMPNRLRGFFTKLTPQVTEAGVSK